MRSAPSLSMGVKTSAKINRLHFVLFLGIFVMLGFYVFFMNSMAGDKFTLDVMNQKIAELRDEGATLELEASQAQALTYLKTRSEEIDLEHSDGVRYVQVKSSDPFVLGN